MKKINFLTFLLLPFFAFSQQKLSLSGKLNTLKTDKKIYLIHVGANGEVIDSTMTNKGTFNFNIPLEKPSVALLMLDHSGTALHDQEQKDVFRFYIAPGNATLSSSDSIAKSKVNGLPIFGEDNAFKAATKTVEDKIQALNQEYADLAPNKKNNEEVMLSFQGRYNAFVAERKEAIKTFIKAHPKSYISLYTLNADLADNNMNVPEIQQLYDDLSADFKDDIFAKTLLDKLAAAKKTGIGVAAMDFEEKTPEGIAIKLSSYKGQYVLLDFWASWCGPCRQENPNVVAAYDKFKSKNFTVLGISLDTSPAAWKKAIKDDALPWTQLLDTSTSIAENYGISSIPQNYLIDPDGKIIAKNLRGTALEMKLSEVLK